jgi:hypothetical protein
VDWVPDEIWTSAHSAERELRGPLCLDNPSSPHG